MCYFSCTTFEIRGRPRLRFKDTVKRNMKKIIDMDRDSWQRKAKCRKR